MRRQLEKTHRWSRQSVKAAVASRLTDIERTVEQTLSKPRHEDMIVGQPEPYALGKDFD